MNGYRDGHGIRPTAVPTIPGALHSTIAAAGKPGTIHMNGVTRYGLVNQTESIVSTIDEDITLTTKAAIQGRWE